MMRYKLETSLKPFLPTDFKKKKKNMEFCWVIKCLRYCLIWTIILTTNHLRPATALVSLPQKIPAIMVFGDSMVDTGNNNNILAQMKSNFPPYGVDFGNASGRFSNGKVFSDIIAEQLGIKDSVPPYSTPNLNFEEILSGVSFASGGAGYDVLTSSFATAISFDDQVKNLKEYKGKVEGLIGPVKTKTMFARSLSLVAAGGDDIFNYFDLTSRRVKYDLNAYGDLLATSASDFVRNLYDTGVRKIGVLGIPPIGCAPSRRTATGCAENLNQAATLFNSKLAKTLAAAAAQLPDSRIVFIDIYNDFVGILKEPDFYGFAVTDKPCCGTGNPDLKYLCSKEKPTQCNNNFDYVYWDGYHPTEDTCRMLFALFFPRYVNQFF